MIIIYPDYPEYPYIGFKDENKKTPLLFPKQTQSTHPGIESAMNPSPIFDNPNYIASGKLKDKVAIISGGDSRYWQSYKYFICKRRSRYSY